LLGSHTNTGDGHLMAAEAGAELSGMEFCVAYSISPAWNSTRTMPYMAARFFDAAGAELDIPPPMSGPGHLRALARALADGPVFADLVDAPPLLKQFARDIQPASLTPFDRKGLDLFEDRFEITLYGEGTIRGTGGLRIVDDYCQTTVRGLFAAGDVATRELVAGATSGGGAQNSAWALTSAVLAGKGAALAAKNAGHRGSEPAAGRGGAGLRPTGPVKNIDERAAVAIARDQIIPPLKALWRDGGALAASQSILDSLWSDIAAHRRAVGIDQVAARETAAVAATARWCNAAALARHESRGMHMRVDAPDLAPHLARRLLVGGLDRTRVRYDRNQPAEAAA
jgi:succinate dehydrogenase/fumarate reductase flavoprotein subunit